MLDQLLQSAQPYLSHYGYAALFAVVFVEGFGLPAPGQTLIMAAAALAIRGEMNLALVLWVAWSAAVLGDNLGFAIGRLGGRRLLLRFGGRAGLGAAELKRVESFFDRYGGAIVVVARFIEGMRQINGIVAGSSGMSWSRFIAFNALGAGLWVGVWGGGVFLFGAQIEAYFRHFRRIEPLLALLGAGAILWLLTRLTRGARARQGR